MRRPLRAFLVFLALLREKIDWRCVRCGASMLFGRRQQCRAFYVRTAGYLALERAKIRRKLPRLRLMERLPDAVMLAGLVMFGLWAHDLLVAASTGTPRVALSPRPEAVTIARAAIVEQPAASSDPTPAAVPTPSLPAVVTRLADGAQEPAQTAVEAQPLSSIISVAAIETPPAAPPLRPAPSRDPSLAGVWGPDASACDKKSSARTGMIPMSISSRGARAGDTTCTFTDLRQNGSTWDVMATCGKGRERWASKVRLTMKGDRLIWSSKRGVSAYVRCDRLMVAGR